MKKPALHLYAIFHLNLAYSSIEEEQRPEVIRSCYWPLLHLARDLRLPFGIEAPGYTLETIAQIDPLWVETLRELVHSGPCEFVGSGYAQIAAPLVPAEVNTANLRLGHEVYERLLGTRPRVALVNEQAYSAGLVPQYLEAGYHALMMEWDNPSAAHPEWPRSTRNLPRVARGLGDTEISVIWSQSAAFQKFQRYAHGEMTLEEYLDYLNGQTAAGVQVFPLYTNDVEIFDFRPGRYSSESQLAEDGEWQRLRDLFTALLAQEQFHFVSPLGCLAFLEGGEEREALQLESADCPIPVKKQGKYNITRWAVTGRDDLTINTHCWQLFESLRNSAAPQDGAWKELCYLWSSDFRTHITEKRWSVYRKRLDKALRSGGPLVATTLPIAARTGAPSTASEPSVTVDSRFVTIASGGFRVRLNRRRGLAIESFTVDQLSPYPVFGTLPHGFYEDINWCADFYSGHLVLELPGRPKVTDLSEVVLSDPAWSGDGSGVLVSGRVATPLGPVVKTVLIHSDRPRVDITYILEWDELPIGSFRLGFVTLNPQAFAADGLHYRTHNGGTEAEEHPLHRTEVAHGEAVSFLVSSQHAVGITEGWIEMGDQEKVLCVEVDKATAALVGLVTHQKVGNSTFCRLALSAGELDETRCSRAPHSDFRREFRVSIEARHNV